jgi:glycolate oxidase iron-sulfur subunit
LGDERDSPRGRIYLVKEMVETGRAGDAARRHLDRCLSCRACETACPSGVEYGRLADLGRQTIEVLSRRPWAERVARRLVRGLVLRPRRLAVLIGLGRAVRPVLPAPLKAMVPPARPAGLRPTVRHDRFVLAPVGCVQPATMPGIDAAAARILDRLGIGLVTAGAGCCGALSHHLGVADEARALMRRNIDAWEPLIERGAEAILVTASGCGAHVKEYGRLLADDPAYAPRAARVAALARDPVELLEGVADRLPAPRWRRVAFQAPCSLQHGQRLAGRVETLLSAAGVEVVPLDEAQLCCGAGGANALLQPGLGASLRQRKLADLTKDGPQAILTANIGCLLHLAGHAQIPVHHWLDLFDLTGGS